MPRISWLAENLLASQEGLCSMELFICVFLLKRLKYYLTVYFGVHVIIVIIIIKILQNLISKEFNVDSWYA
jgi:hypothetical protein